MPHTPQGVERSGHAVELRHIHRRGEGHVRLRLLLLLLSVLLLLHVQLLALSREMLFMQLNLVRQKHLVYVQLPVLLLQLLLLRRQLSLPAVHVLQPVLCVAFRLRYRRLAAAR